MHFQTKRIYIGAESADGTRILIDRLWPRGISKEAAAIDYWAKDVAPSSELRKWYSHDPAKWPAFKERYHGDLDSNQEGIARLRAALSDGLNTVVFASKEEKLNNATALILYLEGRS